MELGTRGIGIHIFPPTNVLGASTWSFVSRQSDICFAYHQGDSESIYNRAFERVREALQCLSTNNKDTFPRISSRNSLLLSPEYQKVQFILFVCHNPTRSGVLLFVKRMRIYWSLELYTREIAHFAGRVPICPPFFSLIRDPTIFACDPTKCTLMYARVHCIYLMYTCVWAWRQNEDHVLLALPSLSLACMQLTQSAVDADFFGKWFVARSLKPDLSDTRAGRVRCR